MEKYRLIQLLNKVETKVNSTMLSNTRKTEINQMLLEIKEEAIDYTRCSEELKDKKEMTFEEYATELGYKRIGNSSIYKTEYKTYKDIEVFKKEYKEYLQTL